MYFLSMINETLTMGHDPWFGSQVQQDKSQPQGMKTGSKRQPKTPNHGLASPQ